MFYDSMKLRVDFVLKDLSQHFGIYWVVFALNFFYSSAWVRGDLKSFLS